ncbi:MAG: hypothetical protein KJO07_20505, partial [Deltaproteobacteria bacterium]|nr:hypothetical protein [Deltaproteobacteria bacterium]
VVSQRVCSGHCESHHPAANGCVKLGTTAALTAVVAFVAVWLLGQAGYAFASVAWYVLYAGLAASGAAAVAFAALPLVRAGERLWGWR